MSDTTDKRQAVADAAMKQWVPTVTQGRIELAPAPCSAPRPKIICICGSSRFCDIAAVHAWNFEKMGILALSMHLLPQWYWTATGKMGKGHGAEQEGVAHVLDELHLRKIDLADEVFVVNEGGYIGDRTRFEIDYALSHGKPVRYMEPNS